MAYSKNKKERRILALWFPRLSTDRLQRKRKAETPATDATSHSGIAPLVIAEKIDNALHLSAIDRTASALGLKVGMTLANARAMLPALEVVPADESADRQALERIADWCERFTPFVAIDFPRALCLDVTGCAHLFGGEGAMLDDIRSGLAAHGFAVRGAIAGTSACARALAQYQNGAIAPPGEDAASIAPLPVEALNLDPVTTHAFRRAGLKTIGQVAARSRIELTARFGAKLVVALEHALSKAEKPISPRLPVPDYSVEHRFAEPIVTQETIAAALKDLAASLSKMLERHGQGARCIVARFFRTDGAVRAIAIETAQPTREGAIVERLLEEKLDALADPLDPGFGYDLIRLCASRAERAAPEAGGFDAGAEAERDVRFLIDRMTARFGKERVLAFQPADTHIPERSWIAVPAQDAQTIKLKWERLRGAGEAPCRPLRLFAKPEPIDVTAEVPDSPPLQFRWRRVLHAVAFAQGPERIAMEWWRRAEPAPTRDYFRVEDNDGRRFWLYREGIYHRETDRPQWFVHGIFP